MNEVSFSIALACMGALITYAATGIDVIAVAALLLNLVIMGGSYALKTNQDE